MSAFAIRCQGCRYRQLFLRFESLPKRMILVGFCLLLIAAVSAIDIWFAVANPSILEYEKNPICKALLELEPAGCSWFILGKSTGTILVLSILTLLHRYRYQQAMLVTISMVVFQLGLLIFLTLSDPITYNLPNFSLLFQDTPESLWIL